MERVLGVNSTRRSFTVRCIQDMALLISELDVSGDLDRQPLDNEKESQSKHHNGLRVIVLPKARGWFRGDLGVS